MRVTPLKASGAGVGELVRYYEGKARDSTGVGRAVGYYSDPDEPPGRWWGAGCDEVGLEGEVVPGSGETLAITALATWQRPRRRDPVRSPIRDRVSTTGWQERRS